MNDRGNESDDQPDTNLPALAEKHSSPGLVREFFQFLVRDAIWWLLAILILVAVVGLVIYLTADRPEPFIYHD